MGLRQTIPHTHAVKGWIVTSSLLAQRHMQLVPQDIFVETHLSIRSSPRVASNLQCIKCALKLSGAPQQLQQSRVQKVAGVSCFLPKAPSAMGSQRAQLVHISRYVDI